MSVMVPDDAPRPRLCHVKKWSDFQGYGFNLHAEKGKVGQYIGSVDDDSPSSHAGVKAGDRIIEVNGTNISNENHQQVVQRIKAVQNETKLLVVDTETDDYYRSRKIVIRGDMPNVHRIEGPSSRDNAHVENRDSRSSSSSSNDSDAPRPRLCIMRIWPDFQGYGFNLHAEKGKPGQFIGKVDANSPAEAAGLREGDRIVEVNNDSVLDENHSQVVSRIKATPNIVRMLVIEPDGERYYQDKGITIHSSMSNVIVGEAKDKSRRDSSPERAPVVAAAAAVHVASSRDDDDDGPSPRLCILRIWPNFQGYGFNLHAEKGKPGQYIGNVDKGSPAEAAGVREGDRIVEINDENVQDKSHAEAVTRIKGVPGSVRMLLIEPSGEKFYRDRSIAINRQMRNIIVGEAEDRSVPKPAVTNEVEEIVENSIEDDGPSPRLCILHISPEFQGYGFNLHAEKRMPGQFVGKVEPGSPADAAGLRKGDHIIEVNDVNVQDGSHTDVVGRIKSEPGRVRLFVIDKDDEEYYKDRGITLHSGMSNVVVGEARERDENHMEFDDEDDHIEELNNNANEKVDGPNPRLCIIRRWPHFKGYGFNLQAEAGRKEHFVGRVDAGSPAESAGLRDGDLIVEVNDCNVQSDTHAKVVTYVKEKPDTVSLLAIDEDGEEYYKSRGIKITNNMSNVVVGDSGDGTAQDENVISQSTVVTVMAEPTPVIREPSPEPEPEVSAIVTEIPSDAPRIRCCTLKKWVDFQGYGFNLHAEKGKPGHFIGVVDPDSPAETAGVKEGDKIMAVNGDSILDSSHQEVVSKIKADPGSVRMLVLEPYAEEYYRTRDIFVSETMQNVDFLSSPEVAPGSQVNGQVTHVEVNHTEVTVAASEHSSRSGRSTPEPREEVQVNGIDREEEVLAAAAISASVDVEEIQVRAESPERIPTPEPELRDPSPERRSRSSSSSSNSSRGRKSREPSPEPIREPSPEPVREPSPEPVREPSPEPVRAPSPKPVKKRTSDDVSALLSKVDSQLSSSRITETKTASSSSSGGGVSSSKSSATPVVVDGMEFAGSAKEMRDRLSRKKKPDPRNASMNMRAKYELYQNL